MNKPVLLIKSKWMTDRNIKLILFFMNFSFLSFFVLKLNTPPVLDEVGTLANTADLLGYDWSQCVYIMGSYYYKYGMSLLYYPLMLIFKQPFIFYKSMMILNIVLLSLIPVLSYTIMRKHLNVTIKSQAALISAVVGTIPSAMLYSMYARADILLIFLPWFMLYSILEAYEAGRTGNNRRQIIFSILYSFLAFYAFMSHTRGVVFIIAALLTAVLIQLMTRQKFIRWIPAAVTSLIMLVIDKLLTGYFMNAVYGTYGTAHASAESFNFSALKLIFTKEGLLSMIKLVIGWVYNVMTSTYGLAGIGVIAAILIIISLFKKSRDKTFTPAESITALFGLLCFLGTFALGCLFFFPVAHDYFTDVLVVRADRLIYGRYTVCAVGIVVMLALYILIVKRGYLRLKSRLVSATIYIAAFLLCIWKVCPYMLKTTSVSRYFISLCTFLKLNSPGTTVDQFPNLTEALIYAGVLGLIVFLLILFFTSGTETKCKKAAAFIVLLVVSLTIFSVNYYKIRLSRDTVLMTWTSEPVELLNELSSITDEFNLVIKDATAKDIKHYQFPCRDYIFGSEMTDAHQNSDYFIVAKKNKYNKAYFNDDFYLFDCFDYKHAGRDVVYVKGHALKEKLEEMGYSMSKYKGEVEDLPLKLEQASP